MDGWVNGLERSFGVVRGGRVGMAFLGRGIIVGAARPPLGLRLVARAPGRWGFCLRGHQPAATSRARANARNASASRVFRTWSGSSQPLRAIPRPTATLARSEEHTSELQSRLHLVCRLLLEKK